MMKTKILVIGALGQLGTELTEALRQRHGANQVIATDLRPTHDPAGSFEQLDVTDGQRLTELVKKHQITEIYHLAAVLSAKGEQMPLQAWQINTDGLLNVLEAARQHQLKVYWPSSIAVFGGKIPQQDTGQFVYLEPTTVYGISKAAGELWCKYYHDRYGVDVRSLRYPGLISYKTEPGGGTTDYAVDIFHKAIAGDAVYDCYLAEETYLPMLYMPDAVRATLELMEADANKITVRTSYNLGGMSFSPQELYQELEHFFPELDMVYNPDFRQAIAESWPDSIDDQEARQDWGWQEAYDLQAMTADMVANLRKAKAATTS